MLMNVVMKVSMFGPPALPPEPATDSTLSLRPSTPCQTNPPITSPAAVHRLLRIKWQPPTLVTTQQRPDMSDCAQTWFKSDQKTTPTSDSVYLSEQPLHRIRVVKRHSCYTDNKLSLIFDPNKKRVICDWYIFATNPVNPGQSKSFSFGLLHSSPNLIFS